MTIRKLSLSLGILLPALAWAAVEEPPMPKKDFTALSQMIHKTVVSQIPKDYRSESGWGQTIPIPDNLRSVRRRQTVQVGDHQELPHGHWRKTHVWLDDPNRDVTIQVRDLRPASNKSYRIALDVDATLHGETEVQQWQKGLLLVDLMAQADARFGLLLECDAALSLGKGFPPEVKVEPKVTSLKVELKDFNLRRVEGRRTRIALALEGEAANNVGKEFKGVLQDMLHAAEPTIVERANEAIARSLREGKGTFSAGALMKALPPKANVQPRK